MITMIKIMIIILIMMEVLRSDHISAGLLGASQSKALRLVEIC